MPDSIFGFQNPNDPYPINGAEEEQEAWCTRHQDDDWDAEYAKLNEAIEAKKANIYRNNDAAIARPSNQPPEESISTDYQFKRNIEAAAIGASIGMPVVEPDITYYNFADNSDRVDSLIRDYCAKMQLDSWLFFGAGERVLNFIRYAILTTHKPNLQGALAAGIGVIGTVACGLYETADPRNWPNTYTLTIAGSGRGKTDTMAAARRVLRYVDYNLVGDDSIASGPGLMKALSTDSNAGKAGENGKDLPKHPKRAVGLYSLDEFADMVKQMCSDKANSTKVMIGTTLKELWSNPWEPKTRNTSADNKYNYELPWHGLSINATAIDQAFFRSCTKEQVIDGFLVRWLLFDASTDEEESHNVHVDQQIPLDLGIPQELVNSLIPIHEAKNNRWVYDPSTGWERINPIKLHLNDEARKLYLFEMRKTDRERAQGVRRIFQTRKMQHAVILALIHAISVHGVNAKEINYDDLVWGLGVTEYSINNMVKYTPVISETNKERIQNRIVETIKMLVAKGKCASGGWVSGFTIRHIMRAEEDMDIRLTQAVDDFVLERVRRGRGYSYRIINDEERERKFDDNLREIRDEMKKEGEIEESGGNVWGKE